MWAIEASPGPKVAYRGGGIILAPAILILLFVSCLYHVCVCVCVRLAEQQTWNSTQLLSCSSLSNTKVRFSRSYIKCYTVTWPADAHILTPHRSRHCICLSASAVLLLSCYRVPNKTYSSVCICNSIDGAK